MALLKAMKREQLGTRKVRRLREQGEIPGIIYGHGEEPLAVTLKRYDLDVAILHGERLMEVRIGSERFNVLIKEVQYDAFGQEVLHVDLTRVSLDERVEVTVEVVLRGTPPGVAEGGMLEQVSGEVTVECAVQSIPDEIRVSVAEMNIGDQLFMRDLPLPEGASLLSEPGALICQVRTVAEEVVEEAPAEAVTATAEPEVIGEKKDQQEQPSQE